jgi:tRNA(Ile)-lysidine synthase
MIDRVKRFMLDNQMVQAGDGIVVGVSGGPDSMVLLHVLKQLRDLLDINIIAAHLNHGLRPEAGEEEEYVRETCRNWGVSFHVRRQDVLKLAQRHKKTVEEAGRDARYQFFSQLMLNLSAHRIATAHHRDDAAETVLLHLLRGAGVKGLRGIMPVSGSIIRPLMAVDRAAILSYAQDHNIKYCTDASNNDTAYLRNRIRLQLMPLLQQDYNPRISENLNQLACIARDENQVMEQLVYNQWPLVLKESKDNLVSLDYPAFSLLLPGLQRRIIIHALSLLAGETGWSMEDINTVMNLATRPGSSRVAYLKKGVKVNKSYKLLVFSTFIPETPEFCYPVEVPGQVVIKETGEVYSFRLDQVGQPREPGAVYLDYDKMGPLELRSRRPGDVFYPYGMEGHKKLKKYFIDLKIPAFERNRIPLLTCGQDIYAVLGYRIASLAATDNDTKNFIVIKKELGEKIIK